MTSPGTKQQQEMDRMWETMVVFSFTITVRHMYHYNEMCALAWVFGFWESTGNTALEDHGWVSPCTGKSTLVLAQAMVMENFDECQHAFW